MPARLSPQEKPRPPVRIVHLGLGAFFRAHGCAYLADIGGWGVLGLSLRSSSVRDALKDQGFSYTAAALTPDGTELRQIDVVRDVLVAPEHPNALIAAMADPDVSLVSMTITEKGYCYDPATGALNVDHPDIQHDIKSPLPRTAPGFLVRGLQARRDAGLPPFTVMSCDNLPNNGAITREVVLALAVQIDPDLAYWIATEGAFPSTMVDRIVPATTDDDINRIAKLAGYHDAAPVMHEPFSQWVITDDFVGERPAFEAAGALIVTDVAPFEHMKLRMLNGAHSALAYLGYLAGFRTVSEAVANPIVAAYLRYLWTTQIIPTVTAPPDTNLAEYADTLMNRFANTGIQHNLAQIAMDGSQKLPQRLLGTIADRRKHGGVIDALLLAVAAWIRYTSGVDQTGAPIPLQDPLAAALMNAHSDEPATTVANFLGLRQVFDPDLADDIQTPLTQTYADLCQYGARAMMERVTA